MRKLNLLTIEQQHQKQISLENYIEKLSYQISDEEIANIINSLYDIYKDNFRHYYSTFYQLIENIDSKSSSKEDEKSLEALQENLVQLLKVVNNKFNNNDTTTEEQMYFIKCINKLVDHLNLEIIRYTNVNSLIKENIKLNNEILNTKKNLKKAKEELKIAKDKLESANNKIENSKIDVITTLSIFSAIILSFTGGISLLTNSFAQIQTTSFFKLTFFILLVGLVLFNAIYLMFHIIGKIIDKKIDILCIKTFNLLIICAIIINFILLFLTNSF